MTTDVLLATFNGARFLGELLSSLEAQTDQDWTLVVRDDGSTDSTLALLEDWNRSHEGRLRLVAGGGKNLGASGNFGALLEATEADYFLLCDQDDVWMPDKIARLTAAMRAAEMEHGRDKPIIVHTDLEVVDERLRPISESFWRYQRLRWPDREAPWKTLALHNVVTGCAMIGNAALRKRALPIPAEAMMHDWWMALVAATMGHVVDDPKPSVRYRQHGGNALGAKSWRTLNTLRWVLFGPFAAVKRATFLFSGTRRQARSFVCRYREDLDPAVLKFLDEYGTLGEAGFLQRRGFVSRHNLWYADLARNIGLALCV